MFLFIATIFIAEMIITLTLIAYIIKADKAVLQVKSNLTKALPDIKTALNGVKSGVHILKEKRLWLFAYIEMKRNQYLFKAIKTILIYTLLFFLRGRCKKAASVCNGILLVKDILDGISA